MLIAFFSDIHEHASNLEKAVKAIGMLKTDMLVCLGDITGYSPLFYNYHPDANTCIGILREKADVVVAGNHDLYTCGRLPSYFREKNIPPHWYDLTLQQRQQITSNKIWLYEDEVLPRLEDENYLFLKSLPEWDIIDNHGRNYLVSHFFKPDHAGISRWFPLHSLQIRDHFHFMKQNHCSLAFTGHRHPPAPIRVNRLFWSNPDDEVFIIKNHHRAIICPAIADGRFPGSFITFDTEKQTITSHLIF